MRLKFNSLKLFLSVIILTLLLFLSCKEEWKPGTPLAKEKIKIGVMHITNPFNESSGYSYAHQMGVEEMIINIGLEDNQILYRNNIDDLDHVSVENSMRELIAQGANIIIATSWGYMDTCEKLAREFPSVVFTHATGIKHNDTNFTNYFGRVYQARYLSGIIAGMQTKTNKIGYVAAWGLDNSEVTSGINAFALGVEKANPDAKVYVMVTYSWFDPMGESTAARALIAAGCDIITQHCDTSIPLTEAQRAGVWGIGYNTDMSHEAPNAVLTSVLWHWGAYYTSMVQSVINGSFNTKPWYGSLNDGIIDLAPLNHRFDWEPEVFQILEEERRRIEFESFKVFSGVMETNDNRLIGREGDTFPDDVIRSSMNWYYRTVAQLN